MSVSDMTREDMVRKIRQAMMEALDKRGIVSRSFLVEHNYGEIVG